MKCERIERLIYLFKEGELSTSEKIKLEEHVRHCKKCQQLFLSIHESFEVVRNARDVNVRPRESKKLTSFIMQRIQQPVEQNTSVLDVFLQYLLRPRLKYSLTIASLFLIGFFMYDEVNIFEEKAFQHKSLNISSNKDNQRVVLSSNSFLQKIKKNSKTLSTEPACFSIFNCYKQLQSQDKSEFNCDGCISFFLEFKKQKS